MKVEVQPLVVKVVRTEEKNNEGVFALFSMFDTIQFLKETLCSMYVYTFTILSDHPSFINLMGYLPFELFCIPPFTL